MQGYLTMATGDRIYLELAVNLALSLKLNDPTRPVCIVTDPEMEIAEVYKPFFDYIVRLAPKSGFHGCLNKLRVNEVSPFEETMFIDSDCILVKPDMDRHWEKHQCQGFNIAGSKENSGNWYNFSIAEAIIQLQIPYMVELNSGVFYFRKGAESDRFFLTALAMVNKHKEILGTFHRNKLQLADEPFIGAALGKLMINPISYEPSEGSIMITTVRSSNEVFDPIKHVSQIVKHSNYRLLDRFFPKTNVKHSPSFAHFVKLKPKPIYNEITFKLRNQFNIQNTIF